MGIFLSKKNKGTASAEKQRPGKVYHVYNPNPCPAE